MTLPLGSFLPLCVLLFMLACWLICYFASPATSIPTRLLVTISFWLGFGGVALLPIDLSLTTRFEEDEYQDLPNETFTAWMYIYWSTFCLAWGILPLVRAVLLSGHFTALARLRAGCRKALRGYIFMSMISLVAVVVLAIRLRSFRIMSVLMALGNTYGLLMVAVLLGYGLVDLPRSLSRMAKPENELRRARIMAGSADEALFDAVWELQDCEDLVDVTISRIERYNAQDEESPGGATASKGEQYYTLCVESLVRRRNATANLGRELQNRRTSTNRRSNRGDDGFEDVHVHAPAYGTDDRPTIQQLAELNAKLQRAQATLMSMEQRWNAVVKQSRFYASLAGGDLPDRSSSHAAPSPSLLSGSNEGVGGCMRSMWMRRLRGPVYRLMSLSMAILSGTVLWSEATIGLPFNVSPFSLFLEAFGSSSKNIFFQIAALIPLLYMSACVYSSLFKLSNFGPYCLRGHNQSIGVALVFNAQYLVRLQFPLGYNYLLMLKYDTSSTNCAFAHVMSDMSTVPFFGTSFSVYAPLMILGLCCFTLCNGYPRLLAVLGIEHEDAILMGDKETLEGKVNEGITLLRRHEERSKDSSRRSEFKDDSSQNSNDSQKSGSWWVGVV